MPEQNPTFAQFLDQYLSGHRSEVRAPAALDYAAIALKRHLGDYQPEQLLPPAIKDYARKREAEGVGPGTILREIGVARAAFSWALAHRAIAAGDVPIIKNPVKAPKSREVWLRRDQARALIRECQFPHMRLFVKLGLMTLARSSAILELRWSQVSFEQRLIDYGEGHGNKRRALVPINDELLADLQAAKRSAYTPYVIEYRGRPVQWVKTAFAAACRRAGLPKNITPHVLRHTGATWLVEDGLPFAEIARMMGDRVEMVERVYGHHSPSYLKRAAAALQLETGG